MTWLCMSEDKFSELMLSFLHVGLGIQTQVFSFGSKRFYPQTSLTEPILPPLRLDKREKFLPAAELAARMGMSGFRCQGRGTRTSSSSMF